MPGYQTPHLAAPSPSTLKHLQDTAVGFNLYVDIIEGSHQKKLGNYGTVSYLTFFEESRRVFIVHLKLMSIYDISHFEVNFKVGEMTYISNSNGICRAGMILCKYSTIVNS